MIQKLYKLLKQVMTRAEKRSFHREDVALSFEMILLEKAVPHKKKDKLQLEIVFFLRNF